MNELDEFKEIDMNELDEFEEEDIVDDKCTCDEMDEEELCPYDLDVHNTETYCFCCPVCRDNCADDI